MLRPGTYANRAGVGLALTHHDAAHRDQSGSTDTVFFGTHHRSHHNVTTRAQTTVGAQCNAFAQVVHGQELDVPRSAPFPMADPHI